jgi:hypothetical protein
MIDNKPGKPESSARSQRRVNVGHEDLLVVTWMPSSSSTPLQEVFTIKII